MKTMFAGELVEVIKIECDEVICDACNKDYTDRGETGGAISNNWAYCQKCWEQWGGAAQANRSRTHVIVNNPLTPFYAFVRAIRARSAS